MTSALFIGSTIYRAPAFAPRHPLAIARVPAVTDLCRALGWLPAASYRTSPRAKPAALTGFHHPDYVAALMRAERSQEVDAGTRTRHGLGTLSNPVYPAMFRRPATAVGGGLLAAELLMGGVPAVFNPGGGTHHGLPDRAAGFCYLNEPVVTIRRLLALGCGRVAYVDLDAHHGDGVELAFRGSDRVRVISVHEEGRWPFTGALEDRAGGAAFNLPVPRGFHDDEFALVLDRVILPAVAGFRPDAIFLQCGADALAEDPLARLGLSNNAHLAALRALRPLAPRLVVSGGGGYNPWSTARLWARIWGELAGHSPPPLLSEPARAVLGGLDWPRRARPDRTMLQGLADAPRGGAITDELRRRVARLAERV
ncbi:acetoin utilization protein AcuC [Roseivivax sp. CAU 1761]